VPAVLLLLATAWQAPPLWAQQDDAAGQAAADADTQAANDEGSAETDAGPDDGSPSLPDIDEILEGDAEILEGGGYTYDPGDRRDPFKSLLAARETNEPRGPRPDGIPGLLIDEIIISGIFRTPEGWRAQVQASDNDKSYLIRAGDELYDGDVVSISANEVVFKQIVQDPTALKPFRDVVKKLNP
jgi:hypothetical protein